MFPLPSEYAYASFSSVAEENFLCDALERMRIQERGIIEWEEGRPRMNACIRFIALRLLQAIEKTSSLFSCLEEREFSISSRYSEALSSRFVSVIRQFFHPERPIPLELSSTIFSARDCLPVLQYVASSSSPSALVHFFAQWKTSLVARMNFLAEENGCSNGMRRLMSREGGFCVFALQRCQGMSDLYIKEKKIGEGAHKTVFLFKKWLAEGKGEPLVAIGQAKREPCEKEEQGFREEENISSFLLRHGVAGIMSIRVVRYYRTIDSMPYRRALMEYCEEGSLPKYLSRKPTVEERLCLCRQMVQILHEMHLMRVVHLDLKPENICVHKGGAICVGDLGSACHVPPGMSASTNVCSTFPPPEMFMNELSNRETRVSVQLDNWNLGNVLYYILVGLDLFAERNLFWNNKRYLANLDRLRQDMVPLREGDPLNSMIYYLISRNAVKRPSLLEVLGAIDEALALVRSK